MSAKRVGVDAGHEMRAVHAPAARRATKTTSVAFDESVCVCRSPGVRRVLPSAASGVLSLLGGGGRGRRQRDADVDDLSVRQRRRQ